MTPDVNLKNYYLNFIYNAKVDAAKYRKKLDIINASKKELIEYLEKYKKNLLEEFNVNLDKFDIEWGKKEYNPINSLYNKAFKIVCELGNHPHKVLMIQLVKYTNLLNNEHKLYKQIELTNKRKDIKFITYRKYVAAYYNKVHKCVLSGFGYRFSYGIGTYVINHWKLDKERMKKKLHLDYAATAKRKREIIAEGKRPYDDKEAVWFKVRNIPYDGVEYRVYKDDTDWYEFTFINSILSKNSKLDYKKTEYVALKYRGMSYKQMANELCRTEEDIYNLQVDVRYKLNILLYKDPTKYLRFVRNAEQSKYQH